MKKVLQELGLNPDNSIVIGSGILQALGIRKSNDVDLVVGRGTYELLKKTGKFSAQYSVLHNFGPRTLKRASVEIGTTWTVLGRARDIKDLKKYSVVINGIRYITIDFLYKAKKSWLKQKDVRQKDIEDVKLIEGYLLRL
jgi:hypothetical protein